MMKVIDLPFGKRVLIFESRKEYEEVFWTIENVKEMLRMEKEYVDMVEMVVRRVKDDSIVAAKNLVDILNTRSGRAKLYSDKLRKLLPLKKP